MTVRLTTAPARQSRVSCLVHESDDTHHLTTQSVQPDGSIHTPIAPRPTYVRYVPFPRTPVERSRLRGVVELCEHALHVLGVGDHLGERAELDEFRVLVVGVHVTRCAVERLTGAHALR